MGISPPSLPFDTRRQNERPTDGCLAEKEGKRKEGRKKGLIEGRLLACSIRLFLPANTAQWAVRLGCHSNRVSDLSLLVRGVKGSFSYCLVYTLLTVK